MNEYARTRNRGREVLDTTAHTRFNYALRIKISRSPEKLAVELRPPKTSSSRKRAILLMSVFNAKGEIRKVCARSSIESQSRLVTPRASAARPGITHILSGVAASPHTAATSMAGVSLRNCGKINLQPLTPRPRPSPQFAFEPAHSFQFIKLAPLVHQLTLAVSPSSLAPDARWRTMSAAGADVNTYDTKSLTRFSGRVVGEL